MVTRIMSPEEKWGDIWFKCSCKYCHIHACCAESILLSMVLNPALKLPPKWSRLEPGDRKRRGRPTEKRVQKLRGEIDARPFPDKADPRAPLRVREMEWDDPQPGMADGEDRSLSSSKKTKVHNSLSTCHRLCIEPMPSPQESPSQPTTGAKGGVAHGEDRSRSAAKKTKVHNSISVSCHCIESMPSPQESASQPTTGTKGGLDGPGEDADFTSSRAGRRRRQAPASQPTRAGQLQEADDDFTPSKLSRPGRSKVHVVHSFGHGTVLHAVLNSVIFDSVKTSI